jgi:hypothetical protein
MIKVVSGWGVRWGAYRHENGLGPSASGSGPSFFVCARLRTARQNLGLQFDAMGQLDFWRSIFSSRFPHMVEKSLPSRRWLDGAERVAR